MPYKSRYVRVSSVVATVQGLQRQVDVAPVGAALVVSGGHSMPSHHSPRVASENPLGKVRRPTVEGQASPAAEGVLQDLQNQIFEYLKQIL
jgi:hypothetical protein